MVARGYGPPHPAAPHPLRNARPTVFRPAAPVVVVGWPLLRSKVARVAGRVGTTRMMRWTRQIGRKRTRSRSRQSRRRSRVVRALDLRHLVLACCQDCCCALCTHIARSLAGTLDAEQIKSLKKQRRAMRNRASATASRQRKKEYLQNLEQHMTELQGSNGECWI